MRNMKCNLFYEFLLSLSYERVIFFFFVVLMVNKNSPKITTVPPSHWEAVIDSPRITNARREAPIGSKTIAIDIVDVLTHFKAQLNNVWPKNVGIIANKTNKNQTVGE